MLRKLLKYEIFATARIFLPIYAVLLIFSAIHKVISLLSGNSWKAPQVISISLYVMILVGMFVVTLVVTIQRFYKNLLSDEGYLMLTLPAETEKHITCKLLVAMMWTVASGIAALFSIFIVAFEDIFTSENIRFTAEFFERTFNTPGAILLILETVICAVIGLASSILIIYTSIAIGHLASKHRVLASLGAFIGLNTVCQILFAIAAAATGSMFKSVDGAMLNDFQAIAPAVHYLVLYMLVFSGILMAGYFVLTNYILKRHLNLE